MHQKPCLFHGLCTALATPFGKEGIDYATLREHIEWQISQNVDALLVCGTTGEASTLTTKERKTLVMCAAEIIDGRVPLIVGTGTNNTETTVAWSHHAKACGANGLLIVTPYYNKGTEEGIVKHYLHVAEKVDLPQIVYHVPTRTGVTLALSQIEALADHPNIVAIKEADTNLDRMLDIILATSGRLAIYAGNDSLTIPTLSMGGIGLISVISNILPAEMGDIIRLYMAGNVKDSTALFYQMLPLMRLLFGRTNPAPIKYALSLCGFGTGEVRLPLDTIPETLAIQIQRELRLLDA